MGEASNEVEVTNWTALIIADELLDDGSGIPQRHYRLRSTCEGTVSEFWIASTELASTNWVPQYLGAEAWTLPGVGAATLAFAIQRSSEDIVKRHVYTHTGWIDHNGSPAFLHAGGALGRSGPVEGIEVRLAGPLQNLEFPEEVSALDPAEAVRRSLRLLEVGPDEVVVPLYAAIWRAPFGEVDYSVGVFGETGAGKSELAALVQQHYGPKLTARNLPGSWTSTVNANERLAYDAKDALIVFDDFVLTGSRHDVDRHHADADRLLRSQGNRSGRLRLTVDTRYRAAREPRGTSVITGEALPRQRSAVARMAAVELTRNGLDWALMTECQADARAGWYAAAMAGFLQWLATDLSAQQERRQSRSAKYRERAANSTLHRRTPDIVANLHAGFLAFVGYAASIGALDRDEAKALRGRGWRALRAVADAQRHQQLAADPVEQFFSLLRASLASGKAHIADTSGEEPDELFRRALGWKFVRGRGSFSEDRWEGQGVLIGWVDENSNLYLEPQTSFNVAQATAQASGEPLSITPVRLRKRMNEHGQLVSVDETRGRLTHRRTLAGGIRDIVHLHLDALLLPQDPPEET